MEHHVNAKDSFGAGSGARVENIAVSLGAPLQGEHRYEQHEKIERIHSSLTPKKEFKDAKE